MNDDIVDLVLTYLFSDKLLPSYQHIFLVDTYYEYPDYYELRSAVDTAPPFSYYHTTVLFSLYPTPEFLIARFNVPTSTTGYTSLAL